MSKNRKNQQFEELEACRFLCRRIPGIHLEDVQLSPTDPPDVVVNSTDLVGIEVRQLLVDEVLKSTEALENEIISLACSKASADPPLMIEFFFRRPAEHIPSKTKSRTCGISKHEKPLIAEQLYHRIAELSNSLQNYEKLDAEIELPKIRLAVTIRRIESLKDHLWQHAMGGFVKSDCVDLIQEAISDKERGLTKYAPEIIRRWLLLVAECDGESSFLDPSTDTLEFEYSSKFDRTFLLNWLTESLHELKTGVTRKRSSLVD